eukprot:COSAG05_NODE_21595_length_270_cov_3.087719_1_plen_52_part_01
MRWSLRGAQLRTSRESTIIRGRGSQMSPISTLEGKGKREEERREGPPLYVPP